MNARHISSTISRCSAAESSLPRPRSSSARAPCARTPCDPTGSRSRAPAIQSSASAQRPRQEGRHAPDRPQRVPVALGAPAAALGDPLLGDAAGLLQVAGPVERQRQLDGDLGRPGEVPDRARQAQRLAQRADARVRLANRRGVASDAAQRADLGRGRADGAGGCEGFLGDAVRLAEVALQPKRLGQDARAPGRVRPTAGPPAGRSSARSATGCGRVGIARPEVVDGEPLEQRPGADPVRLARGLGLGVERCLHQLDRAAVRPGQGGGLGRAHRQLVARQPVDGLGGGRPQAQREVVVREGVAEGEHALRRPPGAQLGPAVPGARRVPRTSGGRARMPRRAHRASAPACTDSTAAATAAWSASRSPGQQLVVDRLAGRGRGGTA